MPNGRQHILKIILINNNLNLLPDSVWVKRRIAHGRDGSNWAVSVFAKY